MKNVPKGWRIELLDTIARRGSGHTPNRKIKSYWNGGIKWVSLADSDKLDRVMISATEHEISEDGIENSSAVKHSAGSVLVSRDAGVGKSAVMADEMAVSQHFIAWKCGPELHNFYLYYWLQNEKPHFERIAVGSTIKTIGLSFFEKLELPFPPIAQQKVIAEILLFWDSAMQKYEVLLAAMVERKRGLMQQLLTGQTRFKAFKGERWRTHRLGELFSERVEIGRTDLPLVAITGQNGVVPRDSLTKRDNSSEDKSKYLRITPGDIGYNTMRMWQGVAGLSQIEGIVSPAYTICIPSTQIDAQFAAYLFKTAPMIHAFHRNSQGLVDDTLSLKYHNFARIHVTIPDVPEQQRIAAVLSACDTEIKLLEKQLEALKEQKRGLMQKLLTGEVRVKISKCEPHGQLNRKGRKRRKGKI